MIIFIQDGEYIYRKENYNIILKKEKKYVTIIIANKKEHKHYKIKITEEELKNNQDFQSIKTQYNLLELFGLSDTELFIILMDNAIKKNNYEISWFKISPLNIRNDTINFNTIISPSVRLVFILELNGYL